MLDFGQFDFGQLAEVEFGRSRIWPKSNLAEVEFGRSRTWPKSTTTPHHPVVGGRNRSVPPHLVRSYVSRDSWRWMGETLPHARIKARRNCGTEAEWPQRERKTAATRRTDPSTWKCDPSLPVSEQGLRIVPRRSSTHSTHVVGGWFSRSKLERFRQRPPSAPRAQQHRRWRNTIQAWVAGCLLNAFGGTFLSTRLATPHAPVPRHVPFREAP